MLMRCVSESHDADFRRGPGSAERQAEALRQEGVEVDADSMGEFYVDLARYGWFPERLPGEESDDSEDEDEAE
jgi:methylated-DNA-protein-cysteine methyltransferase-like protein